MRLLGVREIADDLGVPVGTVHQWRHREKLPEPDWTLAMGPVWKETTLRPFLRRARADQIAGRDRPARSGRRKS